MHELYSHLSTKILGQDQFVESILLALFAQEHLLIIGPPGVGKSYAIETLSRSVGGVFGRIQFTADMLPMDIRGSEVYHPHSGTFEIRKGPLFVNYLLADELNRAPAKVQSALLDAMQERFITLVTNRIPLPDPFCVFATMNHLDDYGTFDLPLAQIDRFSHAVVLNHPNFEIERKLLDLVRVQPEEPLFTLSNLQDLWQEREGVKVPDIIKDYIAHIIIELRPDYSQIENIRKYVEFGPSSRASAMLQKLAQARAILFQRDIVLREDILRLAHRVLGQRVIVKHNSPFSSAEIITQVLDSLPLNYETAFKSSL